MHYQRKARATVENCDALPISSIDVPVEVIHVRQREPCAVQALPSAAVNCGQATDSNAQRGAGRLARKGACVKCGPL